MTNNISPVQRTHSISQRPSCSIGVLALQGDFKEHVAVLNNQSNVRAVEVRRPEQLDTLQGLIIPGGESTVIGNLATAYQLRQPIHQRVQSGHLAIWGTCAGAILLAQQTPDLGMESLNLMNITIQRNAFGRQLNSFIRPISAHPFDSSFLAVFIRAPLITTVDKNVQVLARLEEGGIIAAQEKKRLATVFHPELTNDDRWHRYFIDHVIHS